MKSFSKQEIEHLMNNSEEFKQAILDSKGFILYLADKYTIQLPVNLLIETINPYSIRFVSEHMDNHKYTPEQTAIVISFLTEEPEEDDSVKVTKYSLDDLIEDIKNDKNIPRNANKLLHLNFNDFLAHPDLFVTLIYKSSEDGWGNEFFKNHYLLEPIFKKLTKEQFLQIKKETLYSCPALFHMSKHLMNDEDVRFLFNETVQAYYSHPIRVKGGYRPRLESYLHYQFKSHEKDLFLSLLKNDYSSDYEKIKDYKGFDLFFTKKEYILNHNISGIQYFSEKEIADNLESIRHGILAAFFKPHHSSLEKIYQLKISNDSFRDIFKPAFVQEILTKMNSFHFHYFERDYQKKSDFMNIFHKEVMTLCSDNPDILKLVGYQNSINYITSMLEHNRSYFDDTYAKATQKILTNFEDSLKPDVLFDNFNEKKSDCFSEYDIPAFIFKSMEGKESINYLFALMTIHECAKHWQKSHFVEEINRVVPLLNSEDVNTLKKIFKYKIDSSLLKDNPKQHYDNNFLDYNSEIIKTMPFDVFKSIFEISKDFRTYLLDNDLDFVIKNEKIESLDNSDRYRRDFIYNVLQSISDKKSPYYSFMKSFIKRNKEFMLEHYFSTLVTHPLRESFIKIDTEKLEQDSYLQLETLLNPFDELSLEQHKISALREDKSKKEKKQLDLLNEDLEKQQKSIAEQVNTLLPNLSFNFYSNKIQEADMVKAIQLVNVANRNKQELTTLVFDKVENLDFNTTKSLISNRTFLSYIYNNIHDESHNEKKRSILFNTKFTNEENIDLVVSLLKNFNDSDLFLKQYHKEIPLSKVLSLIPKKRRVDISNDLAIKYDPINLFHSYDYLPRDDMFFKHVSHTYSNEQIFKAIENLDKQGLKIICKEDQNLPHSHLLAYNFKYDKHDGKNPQLPEYLNLLKSLENDPLNYLACIHSDIIDNFIDSTVLNNRDLAKSAFYNDYINMDVFVTAMKEVFDLSHEFYKTNDWYDKTHFNGISIRNANRAISNVISFCYSSYNDKYSSELSEEKSKAILEVMIKKAPYLFFSTSTVGKLNTDREFTENFHEYSHNQLIEDFFISNVKQRLHADYFSLDYSKKDNWQNVKADNFITTIVKNFTEQQDSTSIHLLDFIVKEHKFNEERPYGKKLHDFDSILTSFLANPEYEGLLEKSLGLINIFKLTDRLDNKPRDKIKAHKI